MIGSTNDHEDGQEQLEDVEVVEEGPEDVVLRVEGVPVQYSTVQYSTVQYRDSAYLAASSTLLMLPEMAYSAPPSAIFT